MDAHLQCNPLYGAMSQMALYEYLLIRIRKLFPNYMDYSLGPQTSPQTGPSPVRPACPTVPGAWRSDR